MNLFRFVSIVFFDRINSNRLHRVAKNDVDIRVGLSGTQSQKCHAGMLLHRWAKIDVARLTRPDNNASLQLFSENDSRRTRVFVQHYLHFFAGHIFCRMWSSYPVSQRK